VQRRNVGATDAAESNESVPALHGPVSAQRADPTAKTSNWQNTDSL
jgi:hypothetical protein